jgi:tRNA pseudouridine(55) synthase
VLVDKPAGPSSFALVAGLRRRTGARTGHTGTLDPFATGLLVLLSGSATKLAPCFVGLDKRYLTDIDLTARTSTGDPEGEITARLEPPDEIALERRLARLRGEVELPVPAASAVKIGGERASTRSTSSRIQATRSRSTCASARARMSVRSPTPSEAIAGRSGGPKWGRSRSRRPTRNG